MSYGTFGILTSKFIKCQSFLLFKDQIVVTNRVRRFVLIDLFWPVAPVSLLGTYGGDPTGPEVPVGESTRSPSDATSSATSPLSDVPTHDSQTKILGEDGVTTPNLERRTTEGQRGTVLIVITRETRLKTYCWRTGHGPPRLTVGRNLYREPSTEGPVSCVRRLRRASPVDIRDCWNRSVSAGRTEITVNIVLRMIMWPWTRVLTSVTGDYNSGGLKT